MPIVLRYAKVKNIKGNLLTLIGVNPPNGGHAVLHIAIDQKMIPWLQSIRKSHSFIALNAEGTGSIKARKAPDGNATIQVQLDGKVAPRLDFIEENPAPERTDSYFTLLSYCSRSSIKYNPLFLRELDHELVTMEESIRPTKNIGKFLLNMTDKYGNLLFASDHVQSISKANEWNKTDPFYQDIRYYVESAVSSAKATLDSLAAILNEIYRLGFSKGKIDLASTRSGLFNKLDSTNRSLFSQLKNFESWINKITDYRDFVEHRIMLVSNSSQDIDNKTETMTHLICLVPDSPFTYGDSKNVKFIDAVEFCKAIVEELERIISIVCTDLLLKIKSKAYVP